jgi:hypothetical protein
MPIPPKKGRTQTRVVRKSRGAYRFTFGKHRCKTIQEVELSFRRQVLIDTVVST